MSIRVLKIYRTCPHVPARTRTCPHVPTPLTSPTAPQAAADLQSAHSRLAELRAEAQRAQESLTLGEQSLVLARQKAAEAKQLLNPLEHPKVKKMLGR